MGDEISRMRGNPAVEIPTLDFVSNYGKADEKSPRAKNFFKTSSDPAAVGKDRFIPSAENLEEIRRQSWLKFAGLHDRLPKDFFTDNGFDFDTLEVIEAVLQALDGKDKISADELQNCLKKAVKDLTKTNKKYVESLLAELVDKVSIEIVPDEKDPKVFSVAVRDADKKLLAGSTSIAVKKDAVAQKAADWPTIRTVRTIQNYLDFLKSNKTFSLEDLADVLLPLINKSVDAGIIDGEVDRKAWLTGVASVLSGKTEKGDGFNNLKIEIDEKSLTIKGTRAGSSTEEVVATLPLEADEKTGAFHVKAGAAKTSALFNVSDPAALLQAADAFRKLSAMSVADMQEAFKAMDADKPATTAETKVSSQGLKTYWESTKDASGDGYVSGYYLYTLTKEIDQALERLNREKETAGDDKSKIGGIEAEIKNLQTLQKSFIRDHIVKPVLEKGSTEHKKALLDLNQGKEDADKITEALIRDLRETAEPLKPTDAKAKDQVAKLIDGLNSHYLENKGSKNPDAKPSIPLRLNSAQLDTLLNALDQNVKPYRLKDRIAQLTAAEGMAQFRMLTDIAKSSDPAKQKAALEELTKLGDFLKANLPDPDEKDEKIKAEKMKIVNDELAKHKELVQSLFETDLEAAKKDPIQELPANAQKLTALKDNVEKDPSLLAKIGITDKSKIDAVKAILDDVGKMPANTDAEKKARETALNDKIAKDPDFKKIMDFAKTYTPPPAPPAQAAQNFSGNTSGLQVPPNGGCFPGSPGAMGGAPEGGMVSDVKDTPTRAKVYRYLEWATGSHEGGVAYFDATGKITNDPSKAKHSGVLVLSKDGKQGVYIEGEFEEEKSDKPEKNKRLKFMRMYNNVKVDATTGDPVINFDSPSDKLEGLGGPFAIIMQNASGKGTGPILWWEPSKQYFTLISNDGKITYSAIDQTGRFRPFEDARDWGQTLEADLARGNPNYFRLGHDGKLLNDPSGTLLPGMRPPGQGFYETGETPGSLNRIQAIAGRLNWLASHGGMKSIKDNPLLFRQMQDDLAFLKDFLPAYSGPLPPGMTKESVMQAANAVEGVMRDYVQGMRDGKPMPDSKFAEADASLRLLQAFADAGLQELLRKAGKGKKERDLEYLVEQWIAGNISFEYLLLMVLTVLLDDEDADIARCIRKVNQISAAQKGARPGDVGNGGFLQSLQNDSAIEQIRLQTLISARQRLIETVSNAVKSHQDALMNTVRRIV